MSKTKKFNLPTLGETGLAIAGAILCGLGCGLVNFASVGMDSVGIFYDGIRNVLNLQPDQIGYASYIVSFVLSVFLLFADRKYVSFGSVIYIVFYGLFANLGTLLGETFIKTDNVYIMYAVAISGLILLFIGLGIYIAIDIGVDAFTGVVLWLSNVTHKKMETVKVIFDLALTVIGILLGGKIGVITVVSIAMVGPAIAFFTKQVQKIYFKWKIKKI